MQFTLRYGIQKSSCLFVVIVFGWIKVVKLDCPDPLLVDGVMLSIPPCIFTSMLTQLLWHHAAQLLFFINNYIIYNFIDRLCEVSSGRCYKNVKNVDQLLNYLSENCMMMQLVTIEEVYSWEHRNA